MADISAEIKVNIWLKLTINIIVNIKVDNTFDSRVNILFDNKVVIIFDWLKPSFLFSNCMSLFHYVSTTVELDQVCDLIHH